MFEKRIKDIGMRDISYILYDKNKKVVSIIPTDSVLYILKIEEEGVIMRWNFGSF